MNYILDTNILVTYIRKTGVSDRISEIYSPFAKENTAIISVVSIGEIKSLAKQNNWGIKKQQILLESLNKFLVADINVDTIIDKYAEIDAFSQDKLVDRPLNMSARNMGKNDLWIASTAAVLNLKLLTTDKDFSHLDKEFIDLELIDLKEILK